MSMERSYAGLYSLWIRAWNGEDIDLEEIFDRDVIVRQMPKEHHGIEAVQEMIEQGRAPFDPVLFRVDVEPIFDDHMLAARWTCGGTYIGGLPNVTARPGKQVVFGGIDIWRFSDGKVTDYWVSSDGLWLMEQLNPS
jgi:predicted ester cyclase